MKTPTWAIVVGICMLLFGGCGELKNIQAISMPDIIEMQSKMLENMPDFTIDQKEDSLGLDSLQSDKNFRSMAENMQSMFAISEFTKTWTVRFGYIGIFVTGIYILAGVFLLVRRRFSIKLAFGALILSMVFSILQSVVLTSDSSSLIAKSAGFGNMFGIVIDLILLVIILAMDKSAYKFNEQKIA